jgi:hypothetical protein
MIIEHIDIEGTRLSSEIPHMHALEQTWRCIGYTLRVTSKTLSLLYNLKQSIVYKIKCKKKHVIAGAINRIYKQNGLHIGLLGFLLTNSRFRGTLFILHELTLLSIVACW